MATVGSVSNTPVDTNGPTSKVSEVKNLELVGSRVGWA